MFVLSSKKTIFMNINIGKYQNLVLVIRLMIVDTCI